MSQNTMNMHWNVVKVLYLYIFLLNPMINPGKSLGKTKNVIIILSESTVNILSAI